MNILFLDVDGVLKPFDTYYPEQGLDHKFEKSCVDNLNKALSGLDVQIVICSMWRLDFGSEGLSTLRQIFKDNNIEKEILDVTPLIDGWNKGKEVLAWMDDQQPHYHCNYFVVDDDCNKEWFDDIPSENKIAPNSDFGITEKEQKAIRSFFEKPDQLLEDIIEYNMEAWKILSKY